MSKLVVFSFSEKEKSEATKAAKDFVRERLETFLFNEPGVASLANPLKDFVELLQKADVVYFGRGWRDSKIFTIINHYVVSIGVLTIETP